MSKIRGWLNREREAIEADDEEIVDETQAQTNAITFNDAPKTEQPPKRFTADQMQSQPQHNAFDDLDDILDQEINFSAIDDEPMDTAAALNALDQSHVAEPEKPVTTVVSPARPMPKPKSTYQPPPTAKEKFEQLLDEKPPSAPLPTLDLLDRPDKAKNPISPEELDLNMKLRLECGLTSVEASELIMELEDRYNLQIPDEEALKILTTQDAIDYVMKNAE